MNEQQSDGTAYLRHALALNPLSGGRRNAVRAVRLLEQASELEPTDPIPLYWCGIIYRTFGMSDRAVDYFHRALERDPHHVWSRLELAWVYVQGRDFERARTIMAGVSVDGIAPSASWRYRRLRAILLLHEGRAVEALDAYPPNPPEEITVGEWWREFLHIARVAGTEAPVSVLQRLQARSDELEMLFGAQSGSAEAAPECHFLWALMGHLAGAAGEIEQAHDYRARVPRSSDAYRLVLHTSLRLTDEEARRKYRQGELDAAIELWRQALEEDPDNELHRQWLVHALARRGIELWEAGDVEGAVSTWSEARRHDVSVSPLLHNLAIAYERLEKWAEANKCREAYLQSLGEARDEHSQRERGVMMLTMAHNAYRAGLRQDTRRLLDVARPFIADDATLLARAGLLYASMGDGDKALEACMASLALKPAYEPALQCLVHVTRLPGTDEAVGLSALRHALRGVDVDSPIFRQWRKQTLAYGRRAIEANAIDDAMQTFASLLLADAGDIEGWLWAGAVHMKRGNRTGAEDCFAEAIRLDPNRAETYIDLGARFLAEGDRERAESYFEQAVKASPGPHTHVTIGELCAQIGVPDLAEHHLRAPLTGDKDAEPFLVRAICGLLETGHEDRVRPFLEEAHRRAPESIQLQILVAVQHLRHHEWLGADDSLREAQRLAVEANAEKLLDYVAFFRQALILLRTVGKIDEREFQRQIKTLLEQWLAESIESDPSAGELVVQPIETLLAGLPETTDATPLPSAAPDDTEARPDAVPPQRADLSLFLAMNIPPVGEAMVD